MNNEGQLNSSMIVLDVGAYMSFNADKGEIGFGTREIVSNKSVNVHQYKDYFARKYKTKNRLEYYAGEWVHGKHEGYGTEVLAAHSYTGEWLAGKMDGFGRIAFSTGQSYIGYFKNRTFHGEGTFYGKNHVFEGVYENHKRMNGTYKDRTKQCTSKWENGKIIENGCKLKT